MEYFVTDEHQQQQKSKGRVRRFAGQEMELLRVYPNHTYQEIIGFGGAITEASAHVFSLMDEQTQEVFLDCCFSQRGNAYNFCRLPIQSCDFSTESYAYLEDKRDKGLAGFSLEHDERELIPLIHRVQELCPGMRFLASPWSPPAFMKSNRARVLGGFLRPKYAQRWADMVVRYLEEYSKRNIRIGRITIQNEPFARQTWESCLYTAEQEREFAMEHLVPALREAGLEYVKVEIWDHNKERAMDRADEIFTNMEARMALSGVAFHWYSGDHFDAIAGLREAYPEKELIFSEGCVEYSRDEGGTEGVSAAVVHAEKYAHEYIGDLRAGANACIDWNLLLDEEGGPNHADNFCEAPLMYDRRTNDLMTHLSFSYLWHITHFVKPGARRILATSYTDRLETVAFLNPDFTRILIILNRTGDTIPFILAEGTQQSSLEMAPHSIMTVRWEEKHPENLI